MYDSLKPKNTMFLIGDESTGRNTSIKVAARLLKQKKLLNYDNVLKVDLSLYPTISEQTLFLQDLYKALYTNSDIIIFKNFEKCHSAVIDIISQLVVNGKYKLSTRFELRNNDLYHKI